MGTLGLDRFTDQIYGAAALRLECGQIEDASQSSLASPSREANILGMDAYCIEIAVREPHEDPGTAAFLDRAGSLGIDVLGRPALLRGYLLPASLDRGEAERAAKELLADPVSDVWRIARSDAAMDSPGALWSAEPGTRRILVRRRPGVQDPVTRSVAEGLRDLGIEAEAVGTYRAYLFQASDATREEQIERLGTLLANEVIEETIFDRLPEGLPLPGGSSQEGRVEISLEGLDDAALVALSNKHCFSLNAVEMRSVQQEFERLGRAPTLTELETVAQTWSEHCKHKTLTGRVEMEGGRSYSNFLKETIFATTQKIDHPFCKSVFVDNAGVIAFDDEDCLCIKVETHNHPSAIEPFGGAGTGVGGVIRDIMGTGLGAKPLCNIDVFCVAKPDLPRSEVPAGCLHPARVLDGVIAGVRDYGNPMGIPTVTGAVHFHEDFIGNPLVYCGTVGILPSDKIAKDARPGDHILAAGGRTGRDGIHGATFSSIELTEESEMVSSGAVQIGDPIQEKIVLDAQLEARDRGLYTCVTDCGAGGFSSAVGEMGERIGARVQLERAPLKYAGLTPTEIWISEAQERMVFAVPEDKLAEFHAVFAKHEVETADIGEFTDTGRLELFHEDTLLCDVEMSFLHDGVPRPTRKARYEEPAFPQVMPSEEELGERLLEALGDLAIASKEWICRQYDHEVQGQSAAKPFAGPRQKGPGDAAVVNPKPERSKGFAVATGLNPRYSLVDPASMAEAALDEALRNVVVRGGDPTHCAVLDNYCWGNTDDPVQLGSLVRATEAVCELAEAYRTPFISGKDSLNNEYRVGDRPISIPGCLLVTALAIVPDTERVPDSALVQGGGDVFVVGLTKDELGGSVFEELAGGSGGQAPRADAALQIASYRALHEQIAEGNVLAAHDLSEGGLAVAAAEFAFGGEQGLEVSLSEIPSEGDLSSASKLFSESLGRILVQVREGMEERFETFLRSLDIPCARIGTLIEESRLDVLSDEGDLVLSAGLDALEDAWKRPLSKGPLALVPKS